MSKRKFSIKNTYKIITSNIIRYLSTNRLFLSYIIFSFANTILVRNYTLHETISLKPMCFDLAIIVLIGAVGYLLKPKKQYYYFQTCLCIISFLCIANSVYYVFYNSFASLGEAFVLSQAGEVTGAITEKLEFYQFVYMIFPFIYYYIYHVLSKKNYFHIVEKIEIGRKSCKHTIIVALAILICGIIQTRPYDYRRLVKVWDRQNVVESFGILVYQGNDIVNSLTPTLSGLFGYEESKTKFVEYYSNLEENPKNKYTNKYKDYNVIFVHMESIQYFLLDLNINGVEITPNINNLASEGMLFTNFYPQISVGTSSDTEFTVLTSLMPAQTGTVFVNYTNRYYDSIPNILSKNGYYTFSTHGNKATMWNRQTMHERLGYQDFYSKTSFIQDEIVGLGLSDKSFFKQLQPILENIENTHDKYFGTIITLSNHSPFDDLSKYGDLDLSVLAQRYNEETQLFETVVDPYLNETKMGNYIKSSHYADEALGEFMDYIRNSDHYDNTLFVFYGDHEARLSKKEFNYLYNYDLETGLLLEPTDERYIEYEYYEHELNKNTPLIIWTKDNSIKGKIEYPMGMIDVAPTIGNMVGFKLPYALGNDIFNQKNDNVVMFPNGNFLTSKIYYYNAKEEYKILSYGTIDDEYITNIKNSLDNTLNISNDIIVYDLIKKAGMEVK